MQKFVLRALNHSRAEFLPTYIALRMLVESNSSRRLDLEKFLRRKSSTHSDRLYKHYQILKSANADGEIEYRTAHAASPTALLAECLALQLMASDTVFKNVQNVYSYEWANSDSNYIWKYYYEGFRKRNVDITNKLTQHSGHKAVSIDIRQFYPSVKGRLCLDVLKKMLDRSNPAKSDQQFIFRSARRGIWLQVIVFL